MCTHVVEDVSWVMNVATIATVYVVIVNQRAALAQTSSVFGMPNVVKDATVETLVHLVTATEQ